VRVLEIHSGFRPRQLAAPDADAALQAHREFLVLWPRERIPSNAAESSR
jgi:hypothetical protein